MIVTIILSIGSAVLLGTSFWLWRQREILLRQMAQAQLEVGMLKQEREYFDRTKTDLRDTFQSLAASALESTTQQFFQLAKNNFSQNAEMQKMDFETRQKSIDELLKPVAQALDTYQTHISHIEKERQSAFSAIDGELKRVASASQSLSKETAALKDALKRPHVRGRWGEVQLRNCIELAGMSEYADVSFQNSTSDEDGSRHIPDMIVRMPGGRRVIVDAKTPIEAFMSSLEAPTEELRRTEMFRHGKHVKEHVKKLSARGYSEVIKDSADFTVLFLPNESFLYAALEVEPDLVEFALQKKVLIATPPTLIGLLKVVRFGWSEERLAENAQKISEMGQELHKRLCDFVETYTSVGKHLDKAKEEYERGRMRLESKVLVQGKRFEALGAKSQKSLMDSPPEVPGG